MGSYEQKSIEDIRDAFRQAIPRHPGQSAAPGFANGLYPAAPGAAEQRRQLRFAGHHQSAALHRTEEDQCLDGVPPDGAEHLPEAFRGLDPDNTFHVGAISITSINFQSQKVPNPPESWQALLDPAWAGKITVGSPASSGDVAHWALAMRLKYGDGFFKKFAAQKSKVGQSNVDTVTDILAGERVVGAAAPFSYSLTQKAAGQPVDVKVPTDDAILNLGLTAIPAKAPHPNAASCSRISCIRPRCRRSWRATTGPRCARTCPGPKAAASSPEVVPQSDR